MTQQTPRSTPAKRPAPVKKVAPPAPVIPQQTVAQVEARLTANGVADVPNVAANILKTLITPVSPTVNLTPKTPDEFLAMVMAQSNDFTMTPAYDVPEPESDSPFLKNQRCIGVNLIFMEVAVGPSNFDPMKKAAVYTVLVAQRPDLGMRKLTLTSKWAIAQANAQRKGDNVFPFIATIEQDDPAKGQFASLIIRPCRDVEEFYYHPAEDEAQPYQTPF